MKENQDLSVIETLMAYAADPNNPELELKAKIIIANHFADPSTAFQIAELALARDQLLEVPKLLRVQQQLESELFSEQRFAEASTNELTNLWKAIGEKINARREIAKEAAGNAEKPRIENQQASASKGALGASQFDPRQREQLRRATNLLTKELRLITNNDS